MTRRVLAGAIGFAMLFSAAACGGEEVDPKAAKVPAAAGDFEGEKYKDVVSDLEDAGFTNVETKKIDDLITGWLTSDGEVEDVKINGSKDYDSGDAFPKDAKIVVSFHTFPEKEKEPEPTEEPSEAPSEKPTPTESALPAVLTAKNNADVRAALAVEDNCDPSLGKFAKKYAGKMISFNGSVSAFANHGDADTRFDFLIAPGDKGRNSATGPSFQYRDKNFYDLNFVGKTPDQFGLDDKATFTAEVASFNQDNCLFFLNPVETRVR